MNASPIFESFERLPLPALRRSTKAVDFGLLFARVERLLFAGFLAMSWLSSSLLFFKLNSREPPGIQPLCCIDTITH
jgi:hypothetical protein